MLPRSQRLVAAADHRFVARRGRRVRDGSLVVKCARDATSPGKPARLAVVVPKAAGSAPVRNRLRRRLQNIAAPRLAQLPAGSLIVVRAEPAATGLPFDVLRSSLHTALGAAVSAGSRR